MNKIAELDILQNTTIQNKKLIICFSGVQGCGKTTIAKKIEKRFKAVRISNDYVRDTLAKLYPDVSMKEKETILKKYEEYRSNYLSRVPNGLLVLDSSVDRKYDSVKNFANKFGYKFFLIKMDFSEEEVIKRIQLRGYADAELVIGTLDHKFREFCELSERVSPDYVINSSNNNNLEPLFQLIERGQSSIEDCPL